MPSLEGQTDIGTEKPLLNETVQTLSQMIRDLEKQLENMLEINEALERDLDSEKKKSLELTKERNAARQQVTQYEEELGTAEELRAEIAHLSSERARLATTIEELGHQLAESAQENMKLDRLTERMRVERDDAVEELQSVEAQFERAMEVITDLKARVTTLAEERDELTNQLKIHENQLRMTEDQRDALRTEVEESRKALEQIRREVADACVVSQRYYYPEGENK